VYNKYVIIKNHNHSQQDVENGWIPSLLLTKSDYFAQQTQKIKGETLVTSLHFLLIRFPNLWSAPRQTPLSGSEDKYPRLFLAFLKHSKASIRTFGQL